MLDIFWTASCLAVTRSVADQESLLVLTEVGEAARNGVVLGMQHGAVVLGQTEIIRPIQIRHARDDIVLVFPVNGANKHKVRNVFGIYHTTREAVHPHPDHDAASGFQPLLIGDKITHGIVKHDRIP